MSVHADRTQGFEAGQATTDRPEFITDDHLMFLDDLRESGICNMFGARPHILDYFDDMTERQASELLGYWMKTFGKPGR